MHTSAKERSEKLLSGLAHVLLWVVDEVFINKLFDFGLSGDSPTLDNTAFTDHYKLNQ